MLLRVKLTLIIISMVKVYLYQLLMGQSTKVTGRLTRKMDEEGLSTQQRGLVTKESSSIIKNKVLEGTSGPAARSTRAILPLIRWRATVKRLGVKKKFIRANGLTARGTAMEGTNTQMEDFTLATTSQTKEKAMEWSLSPTERNIRVSGSQESVTESELNSSSMETNMKASGSEMRRQVTAGWHGLTAQFTMEITWRARKTDRGLWSIKMEKYTWATMSKDWRKDMAHTLGQQRTIKLWIMEGASTVASGLGAKSMAKASTLTSRTDRRKDFGRMESV